MIVRDAVVSDVPEVVRLLAQLDLSGEKREQDPSSPAYVRAFEEIVGDPRQQLLVIEEEGGVVATASLLLIPNLSHGGRKVAQIESVVVDERVRGKGFGQALVAECLRRARAAGCFRAQLTSNLARTDAHRFWERMGFTHSHAGFKALL